MKVVIFITLALILTCNSYAQSSQKKVVMISLDGTPDYLVDKFLKSGVLPPDGAFAKMKKNGSYAETVLPINVASTGPSHIAIFTGASPEKTGMVGNTFRKADQSWNSPALSAFHQPINAETIFQAAMRQGKKVMALGGVGLDNNSENRRTDYLHMYPSIVGPSLVLDLVATDTVLPGANNIFYRKLKPDSKSPSLPVIDIAGGFKMPLHLYMAYSAAPGATSSAKPIQIIVDTDANLGNGYSASIMSNNWGTMALEHHEKQYNMSFRIFKTDETAGTVRLFMTAPAEVFGYPSGFLKKLQSTVGLWPGEPENRKQTTGLVSEEIWFEQVDRLAKYSRDLILAGIKEGNWDLLFGYFSTLDDVQHRYTLTNPRQIDYTADNGNRPKIYAGFVEKYFQVIDRYLLDIMNAAPAETNFVIFSDHGMIPIHTNLLLNNYLEHAGFSYKKEAITNVSSGNSAHIYINKAKVNASDYDEYLQRLTASLRSLKDSVSGTPIFDLVANQQQQKKYSLYHKDHSGDLFVSCKPGYAISDRFLPGVHHFVQNSLDPAMFANQNQETKNFLLNGTMNETGRAVHGCLGIIREGQPIFYAIGPGVPHIAIKKIASIQIAATVASLLNIDPPADAEGKAIF